MGGTSPAERGWRRSVPGRTVSGPFTANPPLGSGSASLGSRLRSRLRITITITSTRRRPAGGRYRERQRAARGASRHDRPAPRRHSITVAAAQRIHRGVSFSIAGDGFILYQTGIQAARTEWLRAWDEAWRADCRAARCRSRYLRRAQWWIVPREGER